MQLIYITNSRLPSDKANGIQVAKMAEALTQKLGKKFCLVLPERIQIGSKYKASIEKFYNLKKTPQKFFLPVIDLLSFFPGKFHFFDLFTYYLEVVSFGVASFFFARKNKKAVFYTRDFYLLPFLFFARVEVYYESHYFPTHPIAVFGHRVFLSKIAGVIVLTKFFEQFFFQKKIIPKKILVSSDATDDKFFQTVNKKNLAKLRKQIAPLGETIIGYIGSLQGLGEDKGGGILLKAFQMVQRDYPHSKLLLVGGKFPEKKGDVISTGHIVYNQMPLYFNLIDVAVIPFPDRSHFRYFMSPLKLFDYLAVGKPIVTSNFPSLREIVNEKSAIFVNPGDVSVLANGIERILTDHHGLLAMERQNRGLARKYSWEKRVENILDFVANSKMIYVANVRIPTERAHGKQIIKSCEALVEKGVNLELWLPERRQIEIFRRIEPFDFYGCRKKFRIRKFPTLDFITGSYGRPPFLDLFFYFLQELTFVTSLLKENIDGIIYSRCLTAALLVKLVRGGRVYYEAHNVSPTPILRRLQLHLLRLLDGVVVVSPGIRRAYKEKQTNNFMVIPNGVDPHEFEFSSKSSTISRQSLNIHKDEHLILYAGSISQNKGAFDLLLAAKKLANKKCKIVFLGPANPPQITRFEQLIHQEKISNVINLGFVRPSLVAQYVFLADVLVLPTRSDDHFSREITCPIKLFEYMASGKPIIATNTPAHREFLVDRKNAVLVAADDPEKLASGIALILKNERLARRIGLNAKKTSYQFTWETRGRRIANFLGLEKAATK